MHCMSINRFFEARFNLKGKYAVMSSSLCLSVTENKKYKMFVFGPESPPEFRVQNDRYFKMAVKSK